MLIGFSGGIAAGKDTSYERLAWLYRGQYQVSQVRYADKLKESAAAIFGVTQDFVEGEKRNPDTKVHLYTESEDGAQPGIILTFREFLQRFGTEGHRDVFGESFWIDAALPLDEPVSHEGRIVCVTDVRFFNEQQRILDLGGFLVHLDFDRPGESNPHTSETSIDIDLAQYRIDNSIRDDGFKTLDSALQSIIKIETAIEPLIDYTV